MRGCFSSGVVKISFKDGKKVKELKKKKRFAIIFSNPNNTS